MTRTQTAPLMFATGKISDLSSADRATLFDRSTSGEPAVRQTVAEIIARVRAKGDRALVELAEQLDGVKNIALEVPRSEMRSALERIDSGLRRAMERAAANIRTVHRDQLPTASESSPEPGVHIVRRPDPLRSVGVYAPGGRALYPSSVLMGAIPSRVAGVDQVVLCSPPDSTGLPSCAVLAAAEIAGVDRVFAVGGAGAIAALTYGTDTIPRVDRIVGPGNVYVAEAKLQVAGVVGIDSPAGPSELLILADSGAPPRAVALEVMAQAEHDPRASVVVITIGVGQDKIVADEIVLALRDQPRAAIIKSALRSRGAILNAASSEEAIAFSNEYAPEHLLLACAGAESIVPRLRNAGSIFVGATSAVAFGDYMTGANHVLPTGGLARSYSGLSVLDFIRWTTIQVVDENAATSLAPDVAIFAEAEGLPAHAAAARRWADA